MFVVFSIIVVIVVIFFIKSFETESRTYSPTPQISGRSEPEQDVGLSEQQRLIDQYANSELLPQILNAICDGNYKICKPREIIISCDNIKSDVLGKTIIFDFVSNEVPSLTPLFSQGKILVQPQIAMAEAINQHMGNEYEITDKGETILKEICYYGGEKEMLALYKSNYVMMQLKNTKKF